MYKQPVSSKKSSPVEDGDIGVEDTSKQEHIRHAATLEQDVSAAETSEQNAGTPVTLEQGVDAAPNLEQEVQVRLPFLVLIVASSHCILGRCCVHVIKVGPNQSSKISWSMNHLVLCGVIPTAANGY
jgi:hypothetical protein